MKKLWSYLAILLFGIIIGMVIEYSIVKDNINKTEITTKRIVQKKNVDSSQDITNTIDTKKDKDTRKNKRLLKRKKRANK